MSLSGPPFPLLVVPGGYLPETPPLVLPFSQVSGLSGAVGIYVLGSPPSSKLHRPLQSGPQWRNRADRKYLLSSIYLCTDPVKDFS